MSTDTGPQIFRWINQLALPRRGDGNQVGIRLGISGSLTRLFMHTIGHL
jgi:hypothetical protein